MTQTWHEHAGALASRIGNVERVPDATDFASPRSTFSRAFLMVSSALVGVLGAYFFASNAPLQTALTWLLVAVAFAGGLLSTWSPCGYSSVCLLRPNGRYSARSVLA